MEEVFEKAQFLQTLAEKLKPDLPASACLYNTIILHSRGLCDQFDIYTPRELPDTTIVLYKAKRLGQNQVGVYSGEQEADQVRELLSKTQLVDWRKGLCFFHLPDHLVEVVEGVHAIHGPGTSLDKGTAQVFMYSHPSLLDPIKCPSGLKVCQLGRKGLEMMLASYRYKSCMNTEVFFDFASRVPNVGVYPDPSRTEPTNITMHDVRRAGDEEVPLAWASLVEWGSVGMMNISEPSIESSQPSCSQKHESSQHGSQSSCPEKLKGSQPSSSQKQKDSQEGDNGCTGESCYQKVELLGLAAEVCARLVAREGLYPIAVVEDQDKKDVEMFKNLSGWSHSCKVTWVWKCLTPNMDTNK